MSGEARERFEAWATKEFDGTLPLKWHSELGEYDPLHPTVEALWRTWQAAERDTRERCAQIAHDLIIEIAHYANQHDLRDKAMIGKFIRDKFLSRADAIRRGEEK